MLKLKKIFFSLFIIALLTISNSVLVQQTFAQENKEFKITIDSNYNVNRDGVTKVKHDIKITNQTPTTYLKQYALKSSYFGISNIIVTSNGEKIPANTVQNDMGTSIGITFPDEIVGQGKVRSFSIEYDNHDLASVVGNVLEVHIPKLGDDSIFDANTTTLETPAFFGFPVRVTPEPTSTKIVQTVVETKFDRKNGESVSAIFGSEQVYKMTLRYHLENPTSSAAFVQISLPPDTRYQKLYYHSLDPLPEEMKLDVDGNWIATYKIPASSATVVHLTAEALLTLEPNQSIPYTIPTKDYTQPKKYWESKHPSIIEKATKYTTAKQIYDHVVDTLSYSTAELTKDNTIRKGAVEAFHDPENSVCQEFTDAFIAVSRAAQIPTRRLVGYAYTQNTILRPASFQGDILHSWPEYYDSILNAWIPVDPTWGNTTGGIDYFSQFDLNHIVFAINGASSSLPNPIGAYGAQTDETKDVEITVGEQFPKIKPQLTTAIIQKKLFFIPIPGMYEVSITNDTGQAWYGITPQFIANDQSIKTEIAQAKTIKTLLPFQTKKIDVTFFTNDFSIPKNTEISVNYLSENSDQVFYSSDSKHVISGPNITKELQKPATFIFMGVGIIIIALATGSLLVFRQKRQRSLRRKSKEVKK